jgi:hypothetical protein
MTSETPLCGAETRAGGECRRPAGEGGRCASHANVVALEGRTAGEAFRRDVLSVWELSGPELRLLDQAASTLDVLAELEATVETDGMMVAGSAGQLVLHPAIAEARQQRLAFGRLVSQIDLPDPDAEGDAGATVWTPEAVRARRAAQARWRRRRGGA